MQVLLERVTEFNSRGIGVFGHNGGGSGVVVVVATVVVVAAEVGAGVVAITVVVAVIAAVRPGMEALVEAGEPVTGIAARMQTAAPKL